MAQPDAIVVGGGLSGLGFAFHAAAAGKRALVVEAAPRLGGCLDSLRLDGGFWFEMGAHTCYNSYGALLEVAEGSGILDRILPRGEARKIEQEFMRLTDTTPIDLDDNAFDFQYYLESGHRAEDLMNT